MDFILATGGTGGHIYPAVALSRELALHGYQSGIIGMQGGMEERIASEENIPFYGVSAGKLDRIRPSISGLYKAWQGYNEARAILKSLKPRVVVGFGGYAALPGTLAAQSLGIATILHEQNAKLGITHRLAQAKARTITTAYHTVEGLSPKKQVQVGMPIREKRINRAEALSALGLQEGPLTLLVMGGSQGSLFLNQNVPGALEAACGIEGLCEDDSVQVIHATGARWLPEVANKTQHLHWYKVSGYVDASLAWACADLAITRAGSSTLAEAAFHGVPLMMVPLPSAAENHQAANAKAVEQAGAGTMLPETEIADLPQVLRSIIPREKRAIMRQHALSLSPEGAAKRLAAEVLKLGGK